MFLYNGTPGLVQRQSQHAQGRQSTGAANGSRLLQQLCVLLSHQRQMSLGVQAYITDVPPPKRAGQLLPKSQGLSTLSPVSAPRLPKLKV